MIIIWGIFQWLIYKIEFDNFCLRNYSSLLLIYFQSRYQFWFQFTLAYYYHFISFKSFKVINFLLFCIFLICISIQRKHNLVYLILFLLKICFFILILLNINFSCYYSFFFRINFFIILWFNIFTRKSIIKKQLSCAWQFTDHINLRLTNSLFEYVYPFLSHRLLRFFNF